MNMNYELSKIRNGYIKHQEIDGWKVGDCFLFAKDDPKSQGNIITDIFQATKDTPIIIQYCPEFTPVCNDSAFKHGSMKIVKKYPDK